MLLNDTQEQIREAARQFAQERLAPGAAARDRDHAFPRAELTEMGELGFLGMLVPEEWGGSDLGTVTYALALEEIAAGDGACSTIVSVHSSVGCVPILRFGTEEQKQRFLPKMASGEWIGGVALTEPQAGSDASALKTRARRDGDHYVIDGSKQFITLPIHRLARKASRLSLCRPIHRVMRSFQSNTSSASIHLIHVRSLSQTCAFRWKTGWVKRARATR